MGIGKRPDRPNARDVWAIIWCNEKTNQMKKEKTEPSVTVLAYVPGGIDILKQMLNPVKEVQKNQALRLLQQETKNRYDVKSFRVNYDVTDFGISIAEKESVFLKISRVDGDKIYSVELQLESLN